MKTKLQRVNQFLFAGVFLGSVVQMNAQCPVPTSVTATPSTVCAGTTTSLNATAVGSSISWYTVGVGGVSTGSSASGANFTVSPVNTTTYYAESFVNGTTTFSYTGGLQSYTVPVGITQVTIEAWGAEGGTSTGQAGGMMLLGGKGAYVKGVYAVTPGNVLTLLVGQRGTNSSCGSGGGGGSWVVKTGTLLEVAGGGGGGFHCTYFGGVAGGNGLVTTSGGAGITAPNNGPAAGAPGGTGGNGGTAYFGGGGGGTLTAGFATVTPANAGGAYPGNGGTPGGGYGGGGGYYTSCCGGSGGGGGYSGGSGGTSDGCAGGGGGSFNSGLNQVNTPGVQLGNGQITITYSSCVSASRTAVVVNVNPNPTITVNSGTICSGNSFTIVPSGANTYTIQGGNAVVSPTANANYTVVGTSSAGCVSSQVTSSVAVNASPLPTITVNSGSICSGNSFTIVPSGANTYTIQGGNAVVSPTANASYTVVGTNTAGCVSQSFATSAVTVSALPSLSVSGAGTICVGNSTVLTASGANSYSWNTGATTASISASPTVNTNYTVVGTSSVSGCASTLSTSIVVSPCTGVQTSNLKSEALTVYPNPSNGEFTVELKNGLNKTIEVSDLTGRIVFANTTSKDKVNVNINHLSNGIYYVKVLSNNTSEIIKIVKQ